MLALRSSFGWLVVGVSSAINGSYVVVLLGIAAVALTGIAGTFGLLVVVVPALALFGFNAWVSIAALRARWRRPTLLQGLPR